MAARLHSLALPSVGELVCWHVAVGGRVRKGSPLCSYTTAPGTDHTQLKSAVVGVVRELLATEGAAVEAGALVVVLEEVCDHSIVVFDLCADCGLNLRTDPSAGGSQSTVSMVHSIPEIRISQKEAQLLGNKDKLRLLRSRKLALIVDLDQTLIHTSVDPNIEPGLPEVYGFNLPGHSMLYHCRLRPHAKHFLEKVSQLYEMHIFTMATNSYAATVANILDPEKKLFCDRIISRDECFDPQSKTLRLRSVFPCGDEMVAIIDDREDVWRCCPNLVHVKPYVFFAGTADINAPPRSEPRHRRETLPPPREVKAPPPHRASAPPTRLPGNYSRQKPFKTRNLASAHPAKASPAPSHHPMQTSSSAELAEPHSVDDGRPPLATTHSSGDVPQTQQQVASPTSPPDTTCTSSHVLLNNSNTNNNYDNTTSQENGDSKAGDNESSSSSSSSDTEDSSSSSGSSSNGGIDDGASDDCSSKPTSASKDDQEGDGVDVAEAVPPKSENSSKSASRPGVESKVGDMSQLQAHTTQPVQTPISTKDHSEHEAPGTQSRGAQKVGKRLPEIHDPDDFLVHLGSTLERLHSQFYTACDEMNKDVDVSTLSDFPTPDLKYLIPEMRKSVLKGAKILFTGVIPTNMPPERSREWNTAKAFGATVHKSLVRGLNSSDPQEAMTATTHVVAGKPGTTKLREARKIPGMKVVTPRWLWTCAEQWKWKDESLFGIKSETAPSDQEISQPKAKMVKVEDNPINDSKMESALGKQEEIDMTMEDIVPAKHTDFDQDTFDDNGETFTSDSVEATSDVNRRFQRLDSYISVSDEELEKMDAEVEAEIEGSSSSSSNSNDDTILLVESELSNLNEDESSYDYSIGEAPQTLSRKRKRGEVEESSSSNSPSSISNIRSLEQSEDEDASCSSNDEDDELATLLRVD